MQTCERCNKKASGYDLLDYCAVCSRNLCDLCMDKGCCGHVPAKSGADEDHGETEYEGGMPPQERGVW